MRHFAWVVGLAIVLYGGSFIYRTSFVIEGRRYFCLFDDAMISMRYAANWAAGEGLVWNAGERVEGYTNFLWTMVMGAAHLLPLRPEQVCLLIQILGVGVLVGCMAATVMLARACRLTPGAACCAVALAAAQWNLNFFTLMGMETGLLTLVVTLALRDCVLGLRRGEGRIAPALWFGLGLLIRPDATIAFGFAMLVLLIWGVRNRWRTVLGLAIAGAVLGAHVLWRHHYYGEWLPNTYYLKATGWPLAERFPAGLRTTGWTAVALGLPLLLAFGALIRPRKWQLLLGGAFVLSVVYQTYVGGDAWPKHYRFVLPTSIGLMVLAAYGMDQLIRLVRRPEVAAKARFGLTFVAIIAVNAIHLDHWLLREPPLGAVANRTSVEYALAANRVAGPEATAAVTWAGAFPYYWGGRCYDMLGKSDAHIARLRARPEMPLAGHNKFDPKYTIEQQRPDLVVDGIRLMPVEFYDLYYPIKVVVGQDQLMFSVRRGSSAVSGGKPIAWDEGRQIFESTPRM